MIVTARQLEDLHRQNGGNGHLTLPYRARLSPLAADWIRAKKVVVGYSDLTTDAAASAKLRETESKATPAPAGSIVWWCDGACGPAKAAVIAHERESKLAALDKPADATQLCLGHQGRLRQA